MQSYRVLNDHVAQAKDGAVWRANISHTLFSRGKVGTCHDLPPKTEDFDAAHAANEVLALEDCIKRYKAVRARGHADAQALVVFY
jgi:hypothetical protein